MLRHHDEKESAPKIKTSSGLAAQSIEETASVDATSPFTNTVKETRGKPRREKTTVEEWVKREYDDSVTRFARGAMWLSAASLLLGITAMSVLSILFPNQLPLCIQIGVFTLYGGIAGLTGALIAMVWSANRRDIGVPLMEEYEKRDVGTLIDRIMIDLMHASAIRHRLTQLLPLLQTEDVGLLQDRHYEFLNFYLRQVLKNRKAQIHDKAFLLAVLDSYSRIGDPRALRDIERAARSKALFMHPDPEIQAAARRCLPHLEQVAAKAKAQEHLLRPADTPADPGTLLRPASHSPTADTNLLLRPTETEEAPTLKKPAAPA